MIHLIIFHNTAHTIISIFVLCYLHPPKFVDKGSKSK